MRCQPNGLLWASVVVLFLIPALAFGQQTRPRTLTEALAAAYGNNPALQQQRANLRATDETVPRALSGWRPTVTINGTIGHLSGLNSEAFPGTNAATGQTYLQHFRIPELRNEAAGELTVTEPIFNSGETVAKTGEAKNNVYAARAQLLAAEQKVFVDVVNAYVVVLTNRQILALDHSDRAVLKEQLRAVEDQYRVGDQTETSVAQARAALAQADAQVRIAAGNLKVANDNFRQYVGAYPARELKPPQPLALPVHSKSALIKMAATNNPRMVAALFAENAAKEAVKVTIAALGPQVSVSASAFDNSGVGGPHTRSNGGDVLANLTVPLYQGGAEFAAIRQARDKLQAAYSDTVNARRQSVVQAVQSWESLQSSKATVQSLKEQVLADGIALDGTERQEIVGTSTMLDVLNAQQLLLQAQTQQIENVGNIVIDSYAVVAAMGRLTAGDLDLPVHHYDDLKYYRAVKHSLFGEGNAAYESVGISPNGDLLEGRHPIEAH